MSGFSTKLLAFILFILCAFQSKANTKDTLDRDLTVINKTLTGVKHPVYPQLTQAVLYTGVENKITISSDKYNLNDIRMSISSGSITRFSSNDFLIKVNAETDSNKLIFYTMEGDHKIIIREILCSSRNIADTSLGIIDKTIVKDLSVTKLSSLTVKELLQLKPETQLITFWILIPTAIDRLDHIPIHGERFTGAIIDRLNRLLPGGVLSFVDICILENGVVRIIRPVTYRLVD